MKRNVLIIGAGGVAHVAAHKCAQNNILLGDIHIASRTLSKCQAIITSIKEKNSQCGPGRLQAHALDALEVRSEEHTSELQSLMRISYAVFCLKKKKKPKPHTITLKLLTKSNTSS